MGQTQEWHRVHFWFQRARHMNGPGFILVPKSQTQEWLCFQRARHKNDPGSLWFQRARHRNGSLTYIYIYIFASKLRTPAPMDSKAGTFSVPDTRLFVGHSLVTGRVAPCLRIKFLKLGWRRERTEGKKREVLHLCRCYTHTHTRPEPGQPWKARGREKRTQTMGNRPKQRRGGRERTDLQNQPTRRNGPDKNRAHT